MRTPLKTLGASNLSDKERSELDYYGTNPTAVEALYNKISEDKSILLTDTIWEPCAGHHLIANVLKSKGHTVKCTDIADYGFGDEEVDFLKFTGQVNYDIITNPPYKYAEEFVEKALDVVTPGTHVIMFLRTLFLEGQKRYENIFKTNPPKFVYVFSKRQVCSANDDWTEGSAVSYAWFVWEKGFYGDPIVKWL